jgi:plastocyanin
VTGQPSTPHEAGATRGPDGAIVSRRRLLGAAGIGALALLVTACGDDGPVAQQAAAPGDDEPAGDAPAADGPVVTVLSIDNTFEPQQVEVAPGTTVEWINGGANEHDVLPAEGNPLTDFGIEKEDFPPRRVGVYRYTFTEPGTYEYFCSIHGNMRMKGMVGTVVVA